LAGVRRLGASRPTAIETKDHPVPRRALLLLAVLALSAALIAPATAQVPNLPNPLSDRVVPEPMERLLYLSLDEFNGYLDELAATYGDFMTVGSMGTSEQGREMLEVELTDPSSPIPYEERGVVYLSQNIHANEPGGREGMIRVIEDILRDATAGDPATLDMLRKLRIVQTNVNPDGWASGDLTNDGLPNIPTGYTRGNSDGVDLNRQLPWPGRVGNRDFAAVAESAAMVADADARRERGERVVATGDMHGMLQDEAAVWTMLSSGQFDLGGWVRQREMGEAIAREVEDEIGGAPLLTLTGLAGQGVTAHRLTTSSEFKGGLSGSGFYGDFLAQREGLDSPSVSTIELFFNNNPTFHPIGTNNQLTFVPPLVQVHVDSVRAIVRGMLEAALTEYEVQVVGTGRIGVVHDPEVVEVPRTATRRTAEDTVTPMRFFDDLDAYLEEPTRRLTVQALRGGVPAELSVLVASSGLLVGDPAALAAVREFTRSGGTLVLTDDALQVLPGVDDRFGSDDVSLTGTMIGNAAFTDFDHPLAERVRDGEFEQTIHTYEPSTLGFDTESSGANQAPVWRIDRDVWEAAGGATVATTGGQTSIGELAVGDGVVRVIGGLLPLPTLQNDPRYGLASYAPNDTGMFVFVNALGGELRVDAVPAVFGSEAPGTGGPGTGDPGDDEREDRTPEQADDARLARLSGAGRVETAAQVARSVFDGAEAVVIARADAYPDALAGAPLARALEAPLLLSAGDGLSPASAEVARDLGARRAVLLGGEGALSTAVEEDLRALGLDVERISGPDRFATAAAVARRLGGSPVAFLAAGGPPPDAADPETAGWPDAVAVAPYAAHLGVPVLLGLRDELPAATAAALRDLGVAEVVLVGGGAVLGDEVEARVAEAGADTRRLAGATRYGTSRAIADEAVEAGMAADRLWLATGRAYPDALGAGPAAAALAERLVLVDGADLAGSPETAALLTEDTRRVRILGGDAAVSARTEAQVRQRLGE
jgi:hypothetical protein